MHGWLVFFVMAVFALSSVLWADAEASEKFLIKQRSEQIEELEEENQELQEITLNTLSVVGTLKMTLTEKELADNRIVIKQSTKKRLRIWMTENDQDTLAL